MSTPEATPTVATIGFYLWPNMTALDFVGPHQTLGFAPGVKVFTFARTKDPVVSDTGLTFVPDHGFDDLPEMDIVLVGGGVDPSPEMGDPAVMEVFARVGATARWVTSVCSGALILAGAGLLDGYQANTHWAYRDLLGAYPKVTLADGRVVVDGNRVTGGGVTAGIDIALTLLGLLTTPENGAFMELLMEYNPAPPYGTGHPSLAPAELVAAAQGLCGEMAPDLVPFIERQTGAVLA